LALKIRILTGLSTGPTSQPASH